MTRLTLRALGSFELRRSDGEEVVLPGKKAQALFVYLALQPEKRFLREQLASLLWGDRFDEQARHSLRQCLMNLRQALGDERDVIVSEGDAVRLDLSHIDCDVAQFEALVLADEAAPLERGLDLYGADFLHGLNVRAETFDVWLEDERQRLRANATDALLRLSTLHETAGDNDAAVIAAKRAVAIDPVHEEGHRRLMRLHDGAEHRGEALRQYTACEQALRRELDIEPEAETQRLAEEIRARGERTSEAPAPAHRGPRAWLRMLGNPITASLLIVAGAMGGWFLSDYFDKLREPLPVDIPQSIVVLPFRNLSLDLAQQDLVDGITEGITNALTMVSGMFVFSRNTALTFKDSGLDDREIAAQLGVRYVLAGSVQAADGRVRVIAELIDYGEGYVEWSGSYEREMTDIFAVQDDITFEIITEMQIELTEGEQVRITRSHGTDDLQAWLLAGKALQRLRRFTPRDNAAARALYEQAVEVDPDYSGAMAGVGWTHFIDAYFAWGQSRQTSAQLASEFAQRSMALDPERSPTFALLGYVQLLHGDHAQAVALGEKAVELAPSSADVTALLALTLTYTGDYARSVVLSKAAMDLSPHYPEWYRWTLGRAHRLQGNYKEAERVLTVESAGNEISQARLVELAATFSGMKRWRAARATGRKLLALQPGFSAAAWAQMPPHADPERARLELAALRGAGLPD